jgi:hypothetical protein
MNGGADAEAKIIDAIYRGACDSVELSRALALMTTYFNSLAAALGESDRMRPECQMVLASGAIDGPQIARYSQYAHLDPLPGAFAALAAGTVTTSNRIVPESERRKIFANEYLAPMGANEALGCPLLSGNGRFALISFLQDRNQESFDDSDIARLERLTPHLTRALQIRRLFLQSEARGKALESVIDRNETGMVGLRGDGPALFVNRASRAVAAARDGLGLDRQGRLVAADRAAATGGRPRGWLRCKPMSRAAVPAASFGFRDRRVTCPMSCWSRRSHWAMTCFRIRAAASCLPFTTQPAGKRRPGCRSRSCCTFHSEPPKWCRQSLKA